MVNFIWIKQIRSLLDEQTTASLCLSLCISHLDYCNSLLYGVSKALLQRMQSPKHVCPLSLKKRQNGKCDRLSEASTLVTSKAEDQVLKYWF